MNSDLVKLRERTIELMRHLALIAAIIIILFPVYYIISMSFNPIGGVGSSLIPEKWSLEHWYYVFGIPYKDIRTGETIVSSFPILRWLFNSIKVSFITSILMLILATTSAYALSRFRFKGRKASLLTLMIIQMFPSIMALVAFYLMLNFIGEYFPAFGLDTHAGLIMVYLGGTPFNIWLIKGYFDTIPQSMEESAIMDGCSHFQAFYKILLPLSTPILAVVGLLTFIGTFADFILPSVLLKTQDSLTYAVGIQLFIAEGFSGKWGPFAASCVMGAFPICAIFFSIHKYIVSGLSAGGVKG